MRLYFYRLPVSLESSLRYRSSPMIKVRVTFAKVIAALMRDAIDTGSHVMRRYYMELAKAFIRGKTGIEPPPLDEETLVNFGNAQGLKLHKFKVSNLPRVTKVLGMLRGLQPSSILDIGSGRGTFLWPLLDAFPGLPTTAVDLSPQRISDLHAVTRGGMSHLTAICGDLIGNELQLPKADIITALEVLEHLRNPHEAVRRLLAGEPRFLVASVPSKPNNNPEHIHYFPPAAFTSLFRDAGATRVQLDHVPGHTIALVQGPRKQAS